MLNQVSVWRKQGDKWEPASAAQAPANPAQNLVNGGIDFNEQYLKMNIKHDGNGMVLPPEQQDMDKIRIDGLVPVILNIAPATRLPIAA